MIFCYGIATEIDDQEALDVIQSGQRVVLNIRSDDEDWQYCKDEGEKDKIQGEQERPNIHYEKPLRHPQDLTQNLFLEEDMPVFGR